MKSALRFTAGCAAVAGLLSCGGSKEAAGVPPSGTTPSISGLVSDVISGAPVPGASVAIQEKTATTGSDGRYSIAGLTAALAALTVQRQGYTNFSQNVTISGTTTTNVPLTPSNAARAAGTWRDAASGTTIVVTADTIAQTVTVVVDYKGPGRDPRPETFTVPYSTTAGVNAAFTSPVAGTVALTVSPTGQVAGSVTNIPDPDYRRFDFAARATTSSITITNTISYSGGGLPDVEQFTLTK